MKNKFFFSGLILSILGFRIYLSTFPAFDFDQSAFRFWSLKLAEKGPANFYYSDFFSSNPIGYFYFLWLNGSFIQHFAPWIANNQIVLDLLLKLPANLADIIAGIFIYYLVSKKWGNIAGLIGFSFYTLNPAIYFNSSVWGQYDGIAALSLLLTIFFILVKKLPILSLIFYAISLTLKPQTIFLAPVIGLTLVYFYKFKYWIYSALAFLLTLIIIYLPFFPSNPLYGIYFANQGSASLFNCTTCFALNFWGMFGNWQNDLNKFLGVSYLTWGILISATLLSLVLFTKPIRIKLQIPYVYLTCSMVSLIFFSFLTRIHERYLFSFFIFFLIGALLLRSGLLIILYWILSGFHFLNLYLAYLYYQNLNKPNEQVDFLMANFNSLSIIFSLVVLAVLLVYFLIASKILPND